jgi:glycosyltransferase involved in cell wall biosynthesis
MKIALVSAFPPSGRQLNEYGLHLARELQRNPLLSLTVVADELGDCNFATDAHGRRIESRGELKEFDVARSWKFNSITNPYRVLRTVRELRPDVVWFNLVFSTFATQEYPVAAFAGLTIPALTRAAGFYTHVTLHHLMEHVDMGAANIKAEKLFRFASTVATRMLLMANSISVLLPAYRRTLIDKYSAGNVHFRSHGILGARPEPPNFARRNNPDRRILAIGHWGTYKRLETLMEAFPEIVRRVPNAKLMIAGANHHTKPGYWESFADKFHGNDRIEFLGYVAEDDIPRLFSESSIVVLPYDSSTGASGPAHQACQYGVPVVSSNLPEFIDMAADEGMAFDFFRRGDASDLATKLIRLLQDEERQRAMAEQNFSTAMRMTMPQIIRDYLRAFDVQKRTSAISAGRFRKFARWSAARAGKEPLKYGGWSPWVQ